MTAENTLFVHVFNSAKGRSISSHMIRLGDKAGAVFAKAFASHLVFLSSFEAELDALTRAMKTIRFFENLLTEIGLEHLKPVHHSDNEAMIKFVQGEGVAKGVRHMELRMWYTREQYMMQNLDIMWESGKTITADKLTKMANTRWDQQEFVHDIQGLALLKT